MSISRATLLLAGAMAGSRSEECSASPRARIGAPVTWSAPENLSGTPTPSRMGLNWGKNVAVDDSNAVHVVWSEGEATGGFVAYRRSVDGGLTWDPGLPLSAPAAFTGGAKVAAWGSAAYVIWHSDPGDGVERIFLRRSLDSGASWSDPIALSDAPGVSAFWPSIAAWGPEVHVVWSDGRPHPLADGTADTHSEIYIRSSGDLGATWTPPVSVSSWDGHSSWVPSVAAWAGVVHVIWSDERFHAPDCATTGDCREEEIYRRSTDGGASFGSEVRLTFDPPAAPKPSWAPSIASWGSDVHAVYFDARDGTFRIYYRRSRDAGLTWDAERMVSDALDPANAARPSVAVVGTSVVVTWWREGPSVTGTEVLARASIDAGTSWSAVETLASAIAAAPNPTVAIGPDGASQLVWVDTRDGNDEIYHRRGMPCEVPAPPRPW